MTDHKTRQTARIVEAALHVIHKEGMSRVSISKVAAAAGVTRQTVYNYFPDVESIVARVLEDHAEAMEQQQLHAMRQASGAFAQLRAVADHRISNAIPEHADLDLEGGLSAEARFRIAAHRETVRAALEQAVAAGIKCGEFDDGLIPAVAADLLLELMDGAANAAARHPDHRSFLRDAAVSAMWAVVAPDGRTG